MCTKSCIHSMIFNWTDSLIYSFPIQYLQEKNVIQSRLKGKQKKNCYYDKKPDLVLCEQHPPSICRPRSDKHFKRPIPTWNNRGHNVVLFYFFPKLSKSRVLWLSQMMHKCKIEMIIFFLKTAWRIIWANDSLCKQYNYVKK